jgi:hypothetical protein
MNFSQIFNILYFIFIEKNYIKDKEFEKLILVNKYIKEFLKTHGYRKKIYYNNFNFSKQIIDNIYTYNTFNIKCSDISIFNNNFDKNTEYIQYMKKICKIKMKKSGICTRYYRFSWNYFENLKELYVYTERFNLCGIENLKKLENLVIIPECELPEINKEIYNLSNLKMVILKGQINNNKFISNKLKILFNIRGNRELYKNLDIYSNYDYPYNKIFLNDKLCIIKLDNLMKQIPKLLEWIFPDNLETYIKNLDNFIITN